MSAPRIERLSDPALERANAVYAGLAFEPSVAGRDSTYGVLAEGEPVALGRVQHHADGALEVGGFWVHERFRGRGFARGLVAHVLAHLPAGREVWCLPFAHLVDFYREFGFERAGDRAELPESIRRKTRTCVQRESEGVYHPADLLVLCTEEPG